MHTLSQQPPGPDYIQINQEDTLLSRKGFHPVCSLYCLRWSTDVSNALLNPQCSLECPLDALINLVALRWCHTFPELDLRPPGADPHFPPLRQVCPIRLQQTSHLKDPSMVIEPKILVQAPVYEAGIDDLSFPAPFPASPHFWWFKRKTLL